MNTRRTRLLLLFAFCGLTLTSLCNQIALGIEFYVAQNGTDSWSGRLREPNAERTDGPFATLERARDAIRTLRATSGLPNDGVMVSVRAGIYSREQSFRLTAQDSGTSEAPIVYRATPGETVRLLGGKVVPEFKPVTDPAVLSRLDPAARGQIVQADLRALGVSDFGNAGGGGLELFYAEKPMRLARWPNEGFVKIKSLLGTTPVNVRGTKGCVEGHFTYDGERPTRWVQEKDAWLHGYWFWDWSDQRQKVKAIDLNQKSIELVPPYHGYGYRQGQWFYAYNLLAELDQPGEWYLDRETGLLYFWPPQGGGQAIVSAIPNLVQMEDVSNVVLRGFVMEAARATALTMSGGTNNRIVACTVRNVGGSALSISGGARHGVVGCDVYQCGAGGVSLSGGDRRTLQAADHFAENNYIHDYGRWRPMYSAGLSLDGVGVCVRRNLIANAPHQAISFGGNEHLIEGNEIHSVCYESNDAGAIYSGRDWTMRGTRIRHNYLHDITGFQGRGCVGVYLDDMFCGTEIVGNLFYRVTRAAFIGGGRDCLIENNVFVDCTPAVHIDARALGWAKYHADEWVKEGQEKGTLSGTRFREPPYSTRYPELIKILEDQPWAPKGNVVARNICAGGRWDEIESKARPLVTFRDNLLNEDPCFVNAAALDFRMREDSPAFTLGFKALPLDKMGLYEDENRASWPVRSLVRPASSTAKE